MKQTRMRRLGPPTAALALAASALFMGAPAQAEDGVVVSAPTSSAGQTKVKAAPVKASAGVGTAKQVKVKTVKPKAVKMAAADKDCTTDFQTWEEAQTYFENMGYTAGNDPEGLDGSRTVDDGIACESLPGYDPTYEYGTLTGRNTRTGTQGDLPHAGGPELAGGLGGLALASVGGAMLLRRRTAVAS